MYEETHARDAAGLQELRNRLSEADAASAEWPVLRGHKRAYRAAMIAAASAQVETLQATELKSGALKSAMDKAGARLRKARHKLRDMPRDADYATGVDLCVEEAVAEDIVSALRNQWQRETGKRYVPKKTYRRL